VSGMCGSSSEWQIGNAKSAIVLNSHTSDPPEAASVKWRNERLCRREPSSTWYRQHRHYLHGFTWEDYEVRMVFEELGRGIVRFRANDHVRSHLVAYVFDIALSDLLVALCRLRPWRCGR
jgi:hypothetical protein